MATVTPASWRTALRTRMRDTSTFFTDAQVDEAGVAAFNAAFPALFQIVETTALVPDQTTHKLTLPGTVTAARVFEVIDRDTQITMWGWRKLNATTLRNVLSTGVDVYSWEPIDYPQTSVVIPNEWLDTLLKYGEVYLTEHLLNDLERFRGYMPNSEKNVNGEELQASLQVLYQMWQQERDNHAMVTPIMRF